MNKEWAGAEASYHIHSKTLYLKLLRLPKTLKIGAKLTKKSYNPTRKSSKTIDTTPLLYYFLIDLDFSGTAIGEKAVTLHQIYKTTD